MPIIGPDIMERLIEKAQTLIEALPYIRDFYGTTTVIKYGGAAMVDEKIRDMVIQDIVLMKYVGMNPVLVHGGGKNINAMLSRVGKESEFKSGLRVTDEDTMEITEMVLAGSVNKELVNLINDHGGNAVGICGKDGKLFEAEKYNASDSNLPDLGFVGKVTKVNSHIIRVLDEHGFIPVVASIGYAPGNMTYNINADTAAGELAAAIKAAKLVLLTDTPGILKDPKDPDSLISHIAEVSIPDMKKDGILTGGMLPKVDACVSALQAGVRKTHIIDGRLPHSLLLEIFTQKGTGTEIV
jgi:acetylglutamate kinase